MQHDPWNFVFIVLAAVACTGWVVTTSIMFERSWKRAVENLCLKQRIEELEGQLAGFAGRRLKKCFICPHRKSDLCLKAPYIDECNVWDPASPGVSLPTLDYPTRSELHE
jgi:hypothetical protein